MERVTGLMLRFAKPNPPSQAQSGEFLKMRHWRIFLTEFHLIGSSPYSYSNAKRQCARSTAEKFNGAGDGTRTREYELGKLGPYHLATPANIG